MADTAPPPPVQRQQIVKCLQGLGVGEQLKPMRPSKKINNGEDLEFFFASRAYVDIVAFLRQLDQAMFPRQQSEGLFQSWHTTCVHIIHSPQVMRTKVLVQTLGSMIKEAPPETGPRRFGNVAFRTWYSLLQQRIPNLLRQALPENVWSHVATEDRGVCIEELSAYLLGSFGSAERLDYGTGHELNFLAFLGCLWKLNGFAPTENGSEERAIVVGVIEPYLDLVRRLILTYTLEPAGSHGVWGLDDHSFLPYIFGSAQLSPPLRTGGVIPLEGSMREAPNSGAVIREEEVRRLAADNMYFSAIAFIHDVKKGPIWEHSPILFNISGIKDGWAKINKGLLKMYDAEVLSKFPVVQHFPFGSMFKWEHDQNAVVPPTSVHSRSQPVHGSGTSSAQQGLTNAALQNPGSQSTRAPWTQASMAPPNVATGRAAAQWARQGPGLGSALTTSGSGRIPAGWPGQNPVIEQARGVHGPNGSESTGGQRQQ